MNDSVIVVPASPPVAAKPDLREYLLHPRAVDLWRWQALLWVGLLATPGVALLAFAGEWLAALAVALAAVLAVRLWWAHARAFAARFRCRLLADGVWVDRGVFWGSETFVPRSRVQHTDVNQGPIARRYGIATLKLFTAGTHAAEIDVDGLAVADATLLRDQLLGRGGHDGV